MLENKSLLPGQVCKELGICRLTLRHWESRGIITPQKLEALGWRVYDRAEVVALKRMMVKERRQGLPILARRG
jgi:DNA-binding transcriptional MerR regulator